MAIISKIISIFNYHKQKFKDFKTKINDIKNVLIEVDKVNWSFSNLSGSQLQLFKGLDTTQLQTYITQLEATKAASNGVFDTTAAQSYATAIQGLEAKQAALLLSDMLQIGRAHV